MTSKEALREMCLRCERNIGAQHKGCPWRSLSNDFCDEYEQIKKDLEILDRIDSQMYENHTKIKDFEKENAYNETK